jgi:hypothetical protein
LSTRDEKGDWGIWAGADLSAYDALVRADRLRGLFSSLSMHTGLREEDLVPIRAALLDIVDAVKQIYAEVIPGLARLAADNQLDGDARRDEFLGLVTELKTEFDHIKWHVDEAVPSLQNLVRRS